MQHLEEGTIHAWLDGELSAAEQAQAERHVAECADCAAAVAEARGMIAGASRIVSALDVVHGAGGGVLPRQPAKPAGPRSVWRSLRLTPTRAALAASLLVAAGALFTMDRASSKNIIATPAVASPPAAEMSAQSASPIPAASPTAIPAPTIAASMDSTAMRAAVTPVARKSDTQQRVRAVQPPVLAGAGFADSIRTERVPAANAIAAAPASGVAASDKVAAAPPSAPASNVRTPSSAAAGVAGGVSSVVADRRPEPARAALESLEAKTRLDTVRAAPDSRRALKSSPLQVEQVITTGLRSTMDIAGCYQIRFDSSTAFRLLPDRFALQRTTGTAAPNIVRAVTPDGRLDSVVTGSNWVQISNDKAQIQSTVGTKHQVVSLQLTSLGGVSGQTSTPDGTRPINVARAACRP